MATSMMRVLDPCCGSRMMWFNRQHPDVVFGDLRSETIVVTDRSHGKVDGTRTFPIVRAILEGRKTQTRRVCRLQPHDAAGMVWWPDGAGTDTGTLGGAPGVYLKKCPYGEVGDRLWVRETFAYSVIDPEGFPPEDDPENYDIIYRATYQQGGGWRDGEGNPIKAPWKPSIHMPRWASRITLEITDVRVERLNDISDSDLEAEGIQEWIDNGEDHDGYPRDAFGSLWESINGAGSWNENPWVWVVEFKRVSES